MDWLLTLPPACAAARRRVEFLCHDISWHVPHHCSTKIPWYNLRKATNSLRENWGEYMTECTFNWRMMKTLITELHIFDKVRPTVWLGTPSCLHCSALAIGVAEQVVTSSSCWLASIRNHRALLAPRLHMYECRC